MQALATLWAAHFLQAVGLALVHFIWQGLLIGLVLLVSLTVQRRSSPNVRYVTCLAGMFLMLAAPAMTTYALLSGGAGVFGSRAPALLAAGARAAAVPGWILPLLPWLTGFWVLGASFMQVRLIANWLRAEHIRRTGIRNATSESQRHLEEMRRRLGIGRAVRLVESALIGVPSVIGWISPVILLPVGIATQLSPRQLRAILAHELAHVRRHDYLINLFQNVFESLLFYHPVTWWLSERMRTEREFCCDDLAIAASGEPRQYAAALSSLEELRAGSLQAAMASQGGSLIQRLMRIRGGPQRPPAGMGRQLAPGIVLLGFLATAGLIVVGGGAANQEGGLRVEMRSCMPAATGSIDQLPSPETLIEELARLRSAGLDEDAIRERLGTLVPGVEVHVSRAPAGPHDGPRILCIAEVCELPSGQ